MIEKHQQKQLWHKFKQESVAIEIEFPSDPPSLIYRNDLITNTCVVRCTSQLRVWCAFDMINIYILYTSTQRNSQKHIIGAKKKKQFKKRLTTNENCISFCIVRNINQFNWKMSKSETLDS